MSLSRQNSQNETYSYLTNKELDKITQFKVLDGCDKLCFV